MKIIVDELPSTPSECLFTISHNKSDGVYKPNCKLRMDRDYDWEYRTYALSFNTNTCNLAMGKECPFLKVMSDI